ncbi:retrovirus-related pol polyprotein from transposon TNT 1-94, partial [Tanacetum coccineum]
MSPDTMGNPQLELQEKGVIDSGCSRHMIGNKSYLSDYKEIDGGFVAFGGDPKRGRITGKGKISTDTECVVLSPDFKLLNENHVLLRVPRKDNMYSVDLKNIVPSGGRKPALSFMRPFRCPVIILTTIDHLGSGPNWLFDIDALTKSMNYKPVVTGNQTNGNAGTKENIDVGQDGKKTVSSQEYMLLPLLTADQSLFKGSKDSPNDGFKPSGEEEKKDSEDPRNEDSEVPSTKEPRINQENDANINTTNNINTASDGISTNNVNTVSSTVNVAGLEDNAAHENIVYGCDDDPNMPNLEEIAYSDDDEDVGAEADMNNLNTFILKVWTLVDLPYGKRAIGTKWVYRNKKDDKGIMVRNKARLVAQGYTQEDGIDYDEVFTLVAK